MPRSTVDSDRVKHINFLMSEIHDSSNQIYENLIDQEYPQVQEEIKNQIKKLRHILESTEDEI